jgi:DNA-binding transcriptional MerR regulator
MAPPTYSFAELVAAAGVPERQVRTYLSRGLLPRSDRKGRGALYSQEVLDRLKVIVKIRQQAPTATLDQVAELLTQLDASMIAAIADGRMPFEMIDDGRDEARVVSAEDREKVLRQVHESSRKKRRPDADGRDERPRDPVRLTAVGGQTRVQMSRSGTKRSTAARQLEELIRRLEFVEARLGTSGRTRAPDREPETWHRISAGRDLEIHARGPLDDEQLDLLQHAARLLKRFTHGPSARQLLREDADASPTTDS